MEAELKQKADAYNAAFESYQKNKKRKADQLSSSSSSLRKPAAVNVEDAGPSFTLQAKKTKHVLSMNDTYRLLTLRRGGGSLLPSLLSTLRNQVPPPIVQEAKTAVTAWTGAKKKKKKKSKKVARRSKKKNNQKRRKKKIEEDVSDEEDDEQDEEDEEEEEEVTEDEREVPIKIEFTQLSDVWDGKSSAKKPKKLVKKQLSQGRELIRLFNTGWVKGRITKYVNNKRSNCEIQWADEADGDLRNQLLCLQEYHSFRSKKKPAIGAWFFLQ